MEMSSKIAEGTLGGRSAFVVRKLSKSEYEAELAADTGDDVGNAVGLTAYQLELQNRVTTGEPSKSTASTSEQLVAAFQRVAKGKTLKSELEITDRKVSAPAPEPEASYTQEAAAVALSAAILKAREKS
jgi:hypothetical protein